MGETSKAVDRSELEQINDMLQEVIQRIENSKCRIHGRVASISSFPDHKDGGSLEALKKEPNCFIDSMRINIEKLFELAGELEKIDAHLLKVV
jgi:hypothetical protein